MQVEAVLFDIDGTLVDSNEQHVTAWGLAFREAGHPQEAEAIRGQIGKGGDLLAPALAPDLDKAVRERIKERHGELFASLYLDHIRPFPQAAEMVAAVRKSGRKVVLASSAKRAELDHYVALLGIAGLVDATTSIDDVDTSKPAPDIFTAAIAKVDVAPDRAIVLGDTPYDIEAAARSGIAAVGLTSGPFDERTMRAAGAIAVYCDVGALLADFESSPLAR